MLIGRGGGNAWRTGVACFAFFGDVLKGVMAGGMFVRSVGGDESKGSATSPSRELLSAVPANSEDSVLSSDSAP